MNRHRASSSRAPVGRLRDGDSIERGYAVVFTALILVPLIGFAGLAVDVGGWYSRAAALQRAADAAALAGVVWQPDFATAQSEAIAAAARNGFIHGQDGIAITITDTGAAQLEVEITDTDADLFFSGLFLDQVEIGRSALAEYAAPVPMGSPANVIGAGTQQIGTEPPSNAWAGMMGHCSWSLWGDLRSLRTTDYGAGSCGITPNPYHNPQGYSWIVDVPATHAGAVDINIFDGGYCTSRVGPNLPPTDKKNANMMFTLYPADNTPLTFDDNLLLPPVAQYQFSAGEGCNVWSGPGVHGLQIGAGLPRGQYVLVSTILDGAFTQAYTDTADWGGQNYFSLWASSASFPGYCTTIASSNCPGIYAHEWMPVRTDSTASPAIFYLAEIGEEHEGKTLVVGMWDLGEGMRTVEILSPAGDPLPFTYTTTYSVPGVPHSGTSTDASNCSFGSNHCLDVTGARFDGDLISVNIDLQGALFDWPSWSDDWFQVRYVLDTSSVDWTTWNVQVIGDPVRLLE